MNVTYENGAFVVRCNPFMALTISRVEDIGKLEILSTLEIVEAKRLLRALFIPRDAIPLTVFTKAVKDYAERA